jgi:hypothetical protein
MAEGLGLSLAMHHSQTERVVVTDHRASGGRVDRLLPLAFDKTIAPPERFRHWFIKLCALEETDADRVLFIDGDCLALRNIDPIFDELEGTKFAVMGSWRSDIKHWYGDIAGVMAKRGLSAIPQFSGGFLYYERTPETKQLIDRVMELAANYDEIGIERNGPHVVDEVCISLAMAETGIGEVVPMSRQYSVTPWMSIGRKKLDVVSGECSFVKLVDRPRAFRPYIYHTASAKWDFAYWRELNRVLRIHDKGLGINRDIPHIPFRKLKRVGVAIYRKLIGL